MWNKQASCPRCGTPIRRSSRLCWDCRVAERAKHRGNKCAQCGAEAAKHATLCRACYLDRRRAENLETCRYTCEEYDTLRSWGLNHEQAIDSLAQSFGITPRSVKARLDRAEDMKEVA